jgi:hypothetical protein
MTHPVTHLVTHSVTHSEVNFNFNLNFNFNFNFNFIFNVKLNFNFNFNFKSPSFYFNFNYSFSFSFKSTSSYLFGPEYSSDNSGDGPRTPLQPPCRHRHNATCSLLRIANQIAAGATSSSSSSSSSVQLQPSVSSVTNDNQTTNADDAEIDDNRSVDSVATTIPEQNQETGDLEQNQENRNIALLDIPFADFGKRLLTLAPSMTYIPNRYVKKCRSVFVKIMTEVIEDPNNEVTWKKFFMLPIVLFSDIAGRRRASLDERLNKIVQNNWDTFTLAMFQKRRSFQGADNLVADNQNVTSNNKSRKIRKLAEAGEIGSVMQFIQQDNLRGGVVVDNQVLQNLQQKHPPPFQLIPEEFRNVPSSNISSDLNINPSTLRSIICKRPKLKKPGIDQLRYDHLRVLIGNGGENDADQNEFAVKFSRLVALLVDGKAPDGIYSFLRDNELIALPKNDNDVRPIGMGATIRKIISKYILIYSNQATSATIVGEEFPFNFSHFYGLQYGMEVQGTERIIHSLRAYHEQNSSHDIFLMDADNAFNSSSRLQGLRQIQIHFPHLLPFISRIYAHDSTGWIFSSDEVHGVQSAEGYHQGDVLGSWLFCLTIQPLLDQIKEEIGEEAFVKFFIDDGNIACDFGTMRKILSIINENGEQYGLKIKKSKGVYLLGKCLNSKEARKRKAILVKKYGLAEETIRLHPDNGGDPISYGGKALGSFIGTDEYCLSMLEQMAQKLGVEANNIISKIDSTQVKFLLLKWCFCSKLIYIQRTMPPHLVNAALEPEFTRLKFQILSSIVGCDISDFDDKLKNLVQLSISDGGLSLTYSSDVSYAAYLASVTESFPVIKRAIGQSHLATDLPSATFYKDCLQKIRQDTGTRLSFSNLRKELKKRKQSSSTLQHFISSSYYPVRKQQYADSITDPREMAWFVSTSTSESGMWLDISPKSDMHTMSNPQFEIAIRLRLFMAQKRILEHTKCNCVGGGNRPVTVDIQGIHWCSGCKYDGVRIQTHNSMRDQVSKILRYCGVNTRVEHRGDFAGHDPNNNQRADITCFNLVNSSRPHTLDVQMTSPVPANGAPITMAQAKTPLRAANIAATRKERTYREIAPANNLGFIPVIFEITGSLHDQILKLLRVHLQSASATKAIPFAALWKYWMSSLQIVLQRSLANSIIKRAKSIYGHFEETFDTSRAFMLDFDYVNAN